MTVLALVPARGGSKGLPGKNLALLGGTSLLARAVTAALGEPRIDAVAVSSDDPAILDEARRVGARALTRPADLARDTSSTLDVVLHHLSTEPDVDVLVLLQPTSPLRTTADVSACLDALDGADSVTTVCPTDHPWQWTMQLDGAGDLAPVTGWDGFGGRRQDLAPGYRLNGAVYVVRRAWLEANRAFVAPGTRAVVMPAERSVDVDTALDLALAGAVLLDQEAP